MAALMPGLTPPQVKQLADACGTSFFAFANLSGWQDNEVFRMGVRGRTWRLIESKTTTAEPSTIERTLAFAAGTPDALAWYEEAARLGEEAAQ